MVEVGDDPEVASTSALDSETELIKAAEACELAKRRPRPPKETGSVVFFLHHSGRGGFN